MKRTGFAKKPTKPLKRTRLKKKSSPKRLKEKLEALQKQIVIKKYGNDCYTCHQKDLQGANCQLGHVPWPRSILSPECAFSPEFTRIQCFMCNIHRGGMGAEALERMKAEGIDTDAMKAWNERTKGGSYKTNWYEEQIEHYQQLLQSL